MNSELHNDLAARALVWLDCRSTQRGMRGCVELTLGEGYIADAGAICGLQLAAEKSLVGSDRKAWDDVDDFTWIFESKVSKSDLESTFKHCNHAGDRRTPRANFHYVVIKKNLQFEIGCLPSFWGILEERGRGLKLVRKAEFIKQPESNLYEFAYRILRYTTYWKHRVLDERLTKLLKEEFA